MEYRFHIIIKIKGDVWMSNLMVKEISTVCGVEIPNISGGFGVGKKSMLAKHISDIHEKPLKKINELINNNRKRFKDNIDLIDIKQVGQTDLFLETGILTKAQVGNANNIYLLSERGYAKLIKMFDDDKSWDLYDQLLDGYFEMREELNSVAPINNAPMSQAEMLVMYAQQFVEQEKRMKQIEENVVQMKNYLTETPDSKKVDRAINTYARNKGITQQQARSEVYRIIEDRHGIDFKKRVNNKHKEIQAKRVEEGKNEYKLSTLKQKYTVMNVIHEEDLVKDMMEILVGLS